MKLLAVALLSLSTLLASCAGTPPLNAGDGLLRDALFAPPSQRIEADDALAISPAMRAYIAARMPHRSGIEDRRQQLVDVLYRKSDLQLEYDAALTRTAAQAFDARSGNCLALVLMTAAFAKEMGLAVQYQRVGGDDAWERTDDLTIAIGHVNLTLDMQPPIGTGAWVPDPWTVDFIPQASVSRQHTRLISERTVVAMYLNNRAVESLTEGRTTDAYWWARAALAKDSQLRSAYLTLGVVYRKAGHPALAETALARLLERQPDDALALANRVLVLRDLGRADEAEAVARRVARLNPHPFVGELADGTASQRDRREAGTPEVAGDALKGFDNRRMSRLWLYLDLIRWDRPAGWLLLLWPTLAALWIAAGGFPGWHLLAVFTLGTVLMRSAGCCVNDVADRDFDKHVKRTAQRPVTRGAVSVREALALGAVLALLAFALVLTTNAVTVAWSVGALAVTIFYPFTKRFFSMPQAVLGVAFSFGIPMAFAAVQRQVPPLAWGLLLGNLFWVLAYDTEYAMVDRDDDLALGIRTSAITLGRFDVLAVTGFYAAFLAIWAWLGLQAGLHWPYFVAVAGAAAQAAWHGKLIRGRTREGCFRAFRLNHWLGLTLFAGVLASGALGG